MKYAIIADIHANLEAFQVVLADIKAQNATHIVCWATWSATTPTQGMPRHRPRNEHSLREGKPRRILFLQRSAGRFNPHAADAVHWTREQLSRRNANGCATSNTPAWPPTSRWYMPRSTRRNAGATSLTSSPPPPVFPTKTPRSVSLAIPMCRWPSCVTPLFAAARIQNSKLTGQKIFHQRRRRRPARDNNPRSAYVIYDMTPAPLNSAGWITTSHRPAKNSRRRPARTPRRTPGIWK